MLKQSLLQEKYHYLTDPAFDYIKKELKGDTLQSEEEKHGMKNIHGELIPHIQNIFFNEQKELLKK